MKNIIVVNFFERGLALNSRLFRTVVCLSALALLSLTAAQAQDLRYITWVGGSSKALEDEVVDMFRAQRPEISIAFDTVGGGVNGVREQVVLSLVAGTDVDIALTHSDWVGDLIKQGAFLDLRPFMERDGFDIDAFPKGVIDSYTGQDGGIYALPQQWTTILLAYNKNYFDRYGIAHPDDTWDIFDMETAARTLTIDADGDGAAESHGLFAQSLDEYVWRLWGTSLTNEDVTGSGWHDPRAVDAWQWYGDLYQSGVTTSGANQQSGPWVTGSLSMWLGWPHQHVEVARWMTDSWDVAMHPYGPNGERVARAAGAQWAILSTSDNPEQAWELIKFLASAEAQYEFLVRGRGGVHREAMIRYWLDEFDPTTSGITDSSTLLNRMVMVNAYEYASLDRLPAGYATILTQIIRPMSAKLRNGEAPAASLVPEAARLIDAHIAGQD